MTDTLGTAGPVARAQAMRLPSMSAAVLTAKSDTVWHQALGLASVEPERRVTRHTAYCIGSIAKTFLSALITTLASEQELRLDASISTYLPHFPLREPTIRQLLSHTAGIPREIPTDLWITLAGPSQDEFLQSMSNDLQIAKPGERFHYSNLGYSILGYLVSVVCAVPAQDMVSNLFLEPLKLGATSWDEPETAADGYWPDPYDELYHREPRFRTGSMAPAAELWSTPSDLARWGNAILGNFPSILPPGAVSAMWRPHATIDGSGRPRSYGLGLYLWSAATGLRGGHSGLMPGYSSALVMSPDRRAVAVAAANASTGADVLGTAEELLEADLSKLSSDGSYERLGRRCPLMLRGLLGRWWCEGLPTRIQWTGERIVVVRETYLPSAFSQITSAPPVFTCIEGPEEGERLSVETSVNGEITSVLIGGYAYTRTPYQLGGLASANY